MKKYLWLAALALYIIAGSASPIRAQNKNIDEAKSVTNTNAIEAVTSNDVIYACYQKNNGQLRRVNAPGECKPSEVALSWNIAGQSVTSQVIPVGDARCTNGVGGVQYTDSTGVRVVCNGQQGAQGPPGSGSGIVMAGGGDLSQTGTINRERPLVSAGDFQVFGRCSTKGVSFYVKNLAPVPLKILQKIEGENLTLLSVDVDGSSAATPEKALTMVNFLAGAQQNPFIFTVWGSLEDNAQCSVSGIAVSEV